MAPLLFFDPSALDVERVLHDSAAIEKINPHRGCMRLLDAIVHEDEEARISVAYRDIGHDEFWVAGHIPGRPIFPGVLMVEAGAQLASFVCLRRRPQESFMGFIGIDNVKFRGQVGPGDRLFSLLKEVEMRRKRCCCDIQGAVNGTLVFEGRVTGMTM